MVVPRYCFTFSKVFYISITDKTRKNLMTTMFSKYKNDADIDRREDAVSLLSFYRMNLEMTHVKLVDTAKLMSEMTIQPIPFVLRYCIK